MGMGDPALNHHQLLTSLVKLSTKLQGGLWINSIYHCNRQSDPYCLLLKIIDDQLLIVLVVLMVDVSRQSVFLVNQQ